MRRSSSSLQIARYIVTFWLEHVTHVTTYIYCTTHAHEQLTALHSQLLTVTDGDVWSAGSSLGSGVNHKWVSVNFNNRELVTFFNITCTFHIDMAIYSIYCTTFTENTLRLCYHVAGSMRWQQQQIGYGWLWNPMFSFRFICHIFV